MHESDSRLDRRSQRSDPAAWSANSKNGVVACAHYLAADAGAEILAANGNAADAAVATALALNVCEPAGSGLGGMAMVIGHGFADAPPFFLDGACTAPAAATPEEVATSHRYRGYRAVAVPGAPAALAALHRRWGRLPLAEVVRPAVELARRGCRVTPLQDQLATTYRNALRLGNWRSLVEYDDCDLHATGATFRQPVLADTLEQLGNEGLMSFYQGAIAKLIDRDMREHDGFVTAADLQRIKESEPQAPIHCESGPRHLFTAPPPAGGTTLAQLWLMGAATSRDLDVREPRDVALVAEMIRRARRDRIRHRLGVGARGLGTAAELLEPEFARRTAAELEAGASQGGETSHLCVMDKDGATVSMTLSIERSFGSSCASPDLGFLYNGYLRGFKVENKKHPHYLRPGVPARSNAAPTVVVDGQRTIAIGSTGSERMVSGIFTTLLRLAHEEPFAAVAAPRVHCTGEGELLAEWDRLSDACRQALAGRYSITEVEPYSFRFGGLQLAIRDSETCLGVAELRRDGGAATPESIQAGSR